MTDANRLLTGDRYKLYAIGLFGKQISPWRMDRADAQADAIDMGHASRSEQDGRVYITVPAEIIEYELRRVP